MPKRKTVLYWTLAADWDGNYVPIGVTTEKTRVVYGQRADTWESTHRRRDDCVGRFLTKEHAELVAEDVRKTVEHFRSLRDVLDRQIRKLYIEQRDEIERITEAVPRWSGKTV